MSKTPHKLAANRYVEKGVEGCVEVKVGLVLRGSGSRPP